MSSLLQQLSDAMADLVADVGPSVARVEARRRLPASGIVWSAEGIIVTAHHVVEREEGIRVGLADGATVEATLVGRDPGTDLAVLRVASTGLEPAGVPPARWVEQPDDLRVGHLVLALGRPGQQVQATLGVVSGVGGPWRTAAGGQVDHFLQTDVVMYPGFSGGPLVTADGRLAGLNSSALARGVSLALPWPTVQRTVESLLAHGRVRRGYLGVGIQPVRLAASLQQALGQESGLMILSVEAGGPADQAGLVQGDILVRLDGQPLGRIEELQALLVGDQVGREVQVELVRGGQVVSRPLTIGQHP
ncbi:MAG: serine protease [Litorilinea sp.]|nr:MAG: serine protease [Litorilinea sp.]